MVDGIAHGLFPATSFLPQMEDVTPVTHMGSGLVGSLA